MRKDNEHVSYRGAGRNLTAEHEPTTGGVTTFRAALLELDGCGVVSPAPLAFSRLPIGLGEGPPPRSPLCQSDIQSQVNQPSDNSS